MLCLVQTTDRPNIRFIFVCIAQVPFEPCLAVRHICNGRCRGVGAGGDVDYMASAWCVVWHDNMGMTPGDPSLAYAERVLYVA